MKTLFNSKTVFAALALAAVSAGPALAQAENDPAFITELRAIAAGQPVATATDVGFAATRGEALVETRGTIVVDERPSRQGER